MTEINYHWAKEDYFPYLMQTNKTAILALEYLVDDLHLIKNETIEKFLNHCDSDTLLWNLFGLLSYNDTRVSGNSAYVIGTLAETETGIDKILELLINSQNDEKDKVLANLINMLKSNDAECLMNAAGTIGTISENQLGRKWLLDQSSLGEIIQLCTILLDNQNIWISANAALVLARISIEDIGCKQILLNQYIDIMVKNLIDGLRTDNPGRGMNCAFTIGRLCGTEEDLQVFLKLNNEKSMKKLIYLLCSIVEQNVDYGLTKNACFALTCLADHKLTYNLIINHTSFNVLANSLSGLLMTINDVETLCFIGMLLRILAASIDGCMKLRLLEVVEQKLKIFKEKGNLYTELEEEINLTLEYLKRLEKPSPPKLESVSKTNISLKWDRVNWKNKYHVQYSLYIDGKCIYNGSETSFNCNGLLPFTQYGFQLQIISIEDGDSSELSSILYVTTDESIPDPPTNLRCVGSMTSLMKCIWDPPDKMNGVCKGYFVYKDGKIIDQTNDLMFIVTGLVPSTIYDISVCASTVKGKGPKTTIKASTCSLGDVIPERPTFGAIGRREVFVRWGAPRTLAGKLNRYDLIMNNKCMYSGMSLEQQVIMLKPDTEYKFHVVAITNEGKFKSKVSKVRTLKDEFDPDRPPLYPGSVNKRMSQESVTDIVANKLQLNRQKSISKQSSTLNMKDDMSDTDDIFIKSFTEKNLTLPPVFSTQNNTNKKLNGRDTNSLQNSLSVSNTQSKDNNSTPSQRSSTMSISTRASVEGRISRNNFLETSQNSISNKYERSKSINTFEKSYSSIKTPTLTNTSSLRIHDSTKLELPYIEQTTISPLITYIANFNQTNAFENTSKPLAIVSSKGPEKPQYLLPNETDRDNYIPLQYRIPEKKIHRQKTLY